MSRIPYSFVVVVLALTLAGVVTPAVRAQPAAVTSTDDTDAVFELERALALLDRLDGSPVSVDYDDEPLRNVVVRLATLTPVPVDADWDALDQLGIDPDEEITLRLDAAPLSTVLAALMLRLGDAFERPTFEAYRGQVVLTTLEATGAMRLTDVYDVRDLLRDDGAVRRLRQEARPIPPSAESARPEEMHEEDPDETPEEAKAPKDEPDAPPGGGPPGLPPIDLPDAAAAAGAAASPPTPGEQLMEFVAAHIDADAWLEYGGTRATIGERDGVIFVTAAPTLHRRIRDVLGRLRETSPSAIVVEAAIVDVPRSELERLARRYHPDSAAFARGVVRAAGAVRWRAASGVALDRVLAIESGGGGVEIEIELRPHLDRATGVLSVDLAARCAAPDDFRSVTTTVTVPLRAGGAVVEFPGVTASDEVRLVVLLPRRR